MPTCPHCETDLDASDLCRHEREGLVTVHCPTCNFVLGYYRDRALRYA
ncbi:hypothetical protein [Halomarina litorea]|nr:hypothetical protein [Halomarina sp. BCD28]